MGQLTVQFVFFLQNSPIFPRRTASVWPQLENKMKSEARGIQSSFDCHIPVNLDVLLIIAVWCQAQLFLCVKEEKVQSQLKTNINFNEIKHIN